MAKKLENEIEEVEPIVKKGGFVAVADFELQQGYKSVQYKAGGSFALPEDWQRDVDFEEFSKINRKNGNAPRIVFFAPMPVLDEKGNLKYMDSRRVILPLKEV